MKKWICAVCAWLLCLLPAGCMRTGGGTVQPVTKGFTCQIAMQYRDLALKGQLSRQEDGRLLLTFSEPSSLCNVAIGCDGEKLTMELAGMSIAVDPEKVPHRALIACLQRAFSQKTASVRTGSEGLVVEAGDGGTACTLVCDLTTGLPRSLSMPEEELEAAFSDVHLLTPLDMGS